MEAEGTILISMLVEKTGLNNATLKEKIIEILKLICSNNLLFPIQASSLLVLKGLISKNK
jgi:oligoribonuclease (3'-5' exoribonuclease)